jgi:cell division protein FtsL
MILGFSDFTVFGHFVIKITLMINDSTQLYVLCTLVVAYFLSTLNTIQKEHKARKLLNQRERFKSVSHSNV